MIADAYDIEAAETLDGRPVFAAWFVHTDDTYHIVTRPTPAECLDYIRPDAILPGEWTDTETRGPARLPNLHPWT